MKNDDKYMLTILPSNTKFLFILSLILFLFLPVLSQAKVSGPCSSCHTMHNSQNGSHMQYLAPGESDTGPKDALLRGSCLGCHTATDATTSVDPVTGAPIVFNSVEPTYNAVKGLAAGNFYWVKQGLGNDDAKGHNVFLGEPDGTLDDAPGGSIPGCGGPGPGSTGCHSNLSTATSAGTLTFGAPRQGCTKCHMVGNTDAPMGYHHADDSGTLIDSASQGWYRFLSGHNDGAGHGVSGIEDDDWELETSTDHNEYLGSAGDKRSDYGLADDTMTGYCCGCHGNFHIQDDTSDDNQSPWIRHPSDLVLPNSGEYTAYTSYDPIVPVARPNLSGYSGSSNIINPGIDMVMCLSCHRSHASPYFKMMRWNYKDWPGSGTNGCNVCHTSKD